MQPQSLMRVLSEQWMRLRADGAKLAASALAKAQQISAWAKEYRPFRTRTHKRLALVIGISEYEHKHVNWLENAVNDATAIAERLRKLGFTVCLLENSRRHAIIDAIERLNNASDDHSEIVFYFCGHGLQVAGTNYLVPADGDLVFKSGLSSLINFQSDVVGTFARCPSAKIFVLDACRNDPFDRSPQRVLERSRKISAGSQPDLAVTQNGLGSVEAGEETLIAFAAAPGAVAIDRIDDTSRHSPYTEAMLAHLPTRALALEEMMSRVAQQVKSRTRSDPLGPQSPWSSTNLAERRVVLNPIGLEPCYELAVLGAVAGLITASFTFQGKWYVGSRGAGIWFGLVLAYGVWKWGRGTWSAAAFAAIATTTIWYVVGLLLEKQLPALRGSVMCDEPGACHSGDLYRIAVAAALAGLVALIGTLVVAAVTARALWSVTAWSTTILVATLVLAAIVVVATNLELQSEYLDIIGVYLATAVWLACLGAAFGHAFARHVPSGPNPE